MSLRKILNKLVMDWTHNSEINKEVRSVQNSTEYSAEEKRRILERLIRERNEKAKQTIKYME